ncbi:MAG TPA: hypothetical protein PKC24_13985 [Cyclobacteriaceae bacterium]|nr:hypothetical protein [Cyclobacteriaceae bacterium]
MKATPDYQQDLASIRHTMERSVKFLSLSGLSGILAGIYAILGASLAYYLLYYPAAPYGYSPKSVVEENIVSQLMIIASAVLVLAIGSAYLFSAGKARKTGVSLWSVSSKNMLINMLIPLLSGGLLILIFISQGYFKLVAPGCLIFYGLSLVSASQFTFGEIRFLGFTQIVLGLINAMLPEYGLVLWSLGFGVMHVVYGAVMFYRYEK